VCPRCNVPAGAHRRDARRGEARRRRTRARRALVTYRVGRRGHRGLPRRPARRSLKEATAVCSSAARCASSMTIAPSEASTRAGRGARCRRRRRSVKLALRDERAPRRRDRGGLAPREGHASLHVRGRRLGACPSARARLPVVRPSFEPPRAGLFSYQSPIGACPACRGFGRTIGIDWDEGRPRRAPTPREAARSAPGAASLTTWERKRPEEVLREARDPHGRPLARAHGGAARAVLEGEGTWHGGKYPGVRAWFEWLETRTYKMHVRVLCRATALVRRLRRVRRQAPLPGVADAYRVGDLDLAAWHASSSATPRPPRGASPDSRAG
jgi:excinuclease ABC subunit A